MIKLFVRFVISHKYLGLKEKKVKIRVDIGLSLILRFHCHAINTAPKNTFETVQWKKPRK